jgi:hypothetical protein
MKFFKRWKSNLEKRRQKKQAQEFTNKTVWRIKSKFKLALARAKKIHSLPTAQLYYLEAKIFDKNLPEALEIIFSNHLKKINDTKTLEYYLTSLPLAEKLKKMVQEKLN